MSAALSAAAWTALLVVANLIAGAQPQSNVQIVKQWKLFTYNFPPQAPVQDANFYNPLNVATTCVAVSADRRIFIATPRLFSGVPATLSYASLQDFNESPVLQAYPSWSFSTSWRTDFNCSELILVSVYRMRIDSCNRLWVLDAGRSRSFEDNEATCPPKLLVIDLKTNQVVRRIDFPADVLRPQSLLTNLIIDETTSKSATCDDVFVYIADTVKPALVVYDSQRDRVWRLTHPAMYPDPDFAQLRILNDRFTVMDGIIGLALDTKAAILYFQPLATDSIYSIKRDWLRAGPLAPHQVLPVQLVGKKSSPGLGLLVAPHDGSLIFSPMTETVIAAWNPYTNRQSTLFYDTKRVQFVADISTSRTEPGAIYALSSKFQRFLLKTVDANEYNSRLMRIQFPSGQALSTAASLTHELPSLYELKRQQLILHRTHANDSVATAVPANYFGDVATATVLPTAYSKLSPPSAMRHSVPSVRHPAEHSDEFVPLLWSSRRTFDGYHYGRGL